MIYLGLYLVTVSMLLVKVKCHLTPYCSNLVYRFQCIDPRPSSRLDKGVGNSNDRRDKTDRDVRTSIPETL